MRKLWVMMAVMLFMSTSAFASTCPIEGCIEITPTSPTPIDTGLQTSTSEIVAYLATLNGGAGVGDELYKMNVGGPEVGPLASAYETTFYNSDTDPADALIQWVGPGSITGGAYLLVKDGKHDPAWYLFDLSSWNGTDCLWLTEFWPDGGSISHVALYGDGYSVPEPATMLLFGTGLIGLAGVARKRNKK